MLRRKFVQSSLMAAPAVLSSPMQARSLEAQVHVPVEFSLDSGKAYRDPFREAVVDLVVTRPDGGSQTAPGFWGGDQIFTFRFAASMPGKYRWRTVCSDSRNSQLHGVEGTVDAVPYQGANPLYRRGPVRVSKNRRYLETQDGSPFFWLADTWWMALTKRLGFPDDFARLTEDRAAKGFNVVQLVAGLYPDMDSFDPRGSSSLRGGEETGFPWRKDYATIDPAFWDMADLRIRRLVQSGLTPCVLGCWGYYLPKLGLEKMKQHWRYIVARWGAYPVIWCLAGETSMPWYLSQRKQEEREELKVAWTEMARYVKDVDPYGRVITAHPMETARESVTDPGLLDFDMLQTGHGDRKSIPNTVRRVVAEYAAEPRMPVINGEVCYEGILASSWQDIQRFMFWTCILNGCAGFTYGANGIWQVNLPGAPYGPSPHGRAWGDLPWEEAMRLPGGAQLGWAARWLRALPWHRFEPHPEWVQPHWTEKNYEGPSAAGIPGEMRLLYLPAPAGYEVTVLHLEPGVTYRSRLVNPINGSIGDWIEVRASAGAWKHPPISVMQDWLVQLEAIK